jgi:hypothetical protein
MAFSNENHECWPNQKKYVKTIGNFSESLEDADSAVLLTEKSFVGDFMDVAGAVDS